MNITLPNTITVPSLGTVKKHSQYWPMNITLPSTFTVPSLVLVQEQKVHLGTNEVQGHLLATSYGSMTKLKYWKTHILTEILEFYSLPKETPEVTADYILEAAQKHDLAKKTTGISADNINQHKLTGEKKG
jgi:hypothetical protein